MKLKHRIVVELTVSHPISEKAATLLLRRILGSLRWPIEFRLGARAIALHFECKQFTRVHNAENRKPASVSDDDALLELIEEGISDRMDMDTNSSDWAKGVLDRLREGRVIE